MEELKQISDRVTVMRHGQYVGTVPTAETGMDTLIRLMVGRTQFETARTKAQEGESELLLEVRNLMRGRVIRDVSFTARRGEILGFAGLMGTGRTEVARAVFGADPIDSGEILIQGKRTHISHPRHAVGAGIGYLSEGRLAMMRPKPGDVLDPCAERDYPTAIDRHHPEAPPIARLERFAFYERAKGAFAVIMTGETVKYGNLLLRKGVIPMDRPDRAPSGQPHSRS